MSDRHRRRGEQDTRSFPPATSATSFNGPSAPTPTGHWNCSARRNRQISWAFGLPCHVESGAGRQAQGLCLTKSCERKSLGVEIGCLFPQQHTVTVKKTLIEL